MTWVRAGISLLVCLGSFAVSALAFGPSEWKEARIGLPIAMAFWVGLLWGMSPAINSPLRPFAIAWGVAFAAEAGIVYAGGRGSPSGVLLSGCLTSTLALIALRKVPPLRLPAEKPDRIVLDAPDYFRRRSPRQLLDLKLAGVRIETETGRSQRLFRRVAVEKISPLDLLTSGSHRVSRVVMAIQAIYSNLIGITFLVLLSPLLFVGGLLARVAAGPGPLFDKVECAGFQGVPFFRRSFRTVNAITGQPTSVGRWLTRMHLRGLPQLINLVRGEMALFGPQPVRKVFADRLEAVPIFGRRLSVKPGIVGWAQANAEKNAPRTNTTANDLRSEIQEEVARIAYDLYYLQFGSPLMDLEILGRTLFRPFLVRRVG
jgi:lipopolysaccharide/colanic/teichoic acid biosynthesis glycosyltransferase